MRSAVAAAHDEPRCFGAEVTRGAKRSVAAAAHGEPQRFGAAGIRGTRRSLAVTVLRRRGGREAVTVGGERGASASGNLPGVGAADGRHGVSAPCWRAAVAVAQRSCRASVRRGRGKTAGVVCGGSAFRRWPALVERSIWTRSRFGGSAKGETRAVFATRAFRRARPGASVNVLRTEGRPRLRSQVDGPLAAPTSRRFVLRREAVGIGRGVYGRANVMRGTAPATAYGHVRGAKL